MNFLAGPTSFFLCLLWFLQTWWTCLRATHARNMVSTDSTEWPSPRRQGLCMGREGRDMTGNSVTKVDTLSLLSARRLKRWSFPEAGMYQVHLQTWGDAGCQEMRATWTQFWADFVMTTVEQWTLGNSLGMLLNHVLSFYSTKEVWESAVFSILVGVLEHISWWPRGGTICV